MSLASLPTLDWCRSRSLKFPSSLAFVRATKNNHSRTTSASSTFSLWFRSWRHSLRRSSLLSRHLAWPFSRPIRSWTSFFSSPARTHTFLFSCVSIYQFWSLLAVCYFLLSDRFFLFSSSHIHPHLIEWHLILSTHSNNFPVTSLLLFIQTFQHPFSAVSCFRLVILLNNDFIWPSLLVIETIVAYFSSFFRRPCLLFSVFICGQISQDFFIDLGWSNCLFFLVTRLLFLLSWLFPFSRHTQTSRTQLTGKQLSPNLFLVCCFRSILGGPGTRYRLLLSVLFFSDLVGTVALPSLSFPSRLSSIPLIV